MSNKLKTLVIQHLTSSAITFVGFFLFTFSGLILVDGFTFSSSALYSALTSAILAGVRAVAVIVYDISKELIKSSKE